VGGVGAGQIGEGAGHPIGDPEAAGHAGAKNQTSPRRHEDTEKDKR
jgi:hypothetical protein